MEKSSIFCFCWLHILLIDCDTLKYLLFLMPWMILVRVWQTHDNLVLEPIVQLTMDVLDMLIWLQ